MISAGLADFLAWRVPAITDAEANAEPWAVFRADTGFVGRAADLVRATRLSGSTGGGDDVPRRLRNTITLETLEWTRAHGWSTTQRARSADSKPRASASIPDEADPDSPRYRRDIYE